MPSYEEMMEYVLDAGRECECCNFTGVCSGITRGPEGPIFPPCSYKDFDKILVADQVERIYREAHTND